MRAGERLGDRFELEREAGQGGMGTVYRALDLATGARVAVKVLNVGADTARFEREARLLSELRHPGIVDYVAHGSHASGAPWLAMEWLEGEDLKTRLARCGLTLAETLTLGVRVARALGYAHVAGVVHRDLKPSNLWLVDGEVARPKVIDFGIALDRAADTRTTRTGLVVGTPSFMAPEQARGGKAIDARADLFSLGCLLYLCLTGRLPFEGDDLLAILAKIIVDEVVPPSALAPEVPEALEDLVLAMLAKSPGDRPLDGNAVAARLEALAELPTLVEGGRGPRSTAAPSLTNAERRFTSLIVLGESRVTSAASLDDEGSATVLESLFRSVEAFHARMESLVDGSILVLLPGGGAATDQATRAAACALELRDSAPEAAMALATGAAEVDMDVPVGEAIDRAVKLLRAAHPSDAPQIRVDAMTRALLEERFTVRQDRDSFVLVGPREQEDARTLLGLPTPCVGRDAELAMLEAVLTQCIEERTARAILITGPAGIGKSRLRHELMRKLPALDPRAVVWTARGDSVSAGSAFGLAAQMIRRAASVVEGEPVESRRAKLTAFVRSYISEADERVASFLGELVGAPFSEVDNPSLRAARVDARLMGELLRGAFCDLASACSVAAPLVILLEDLHWGDLPTVNLVGHALRILADRPLFVVAYARPEIDAIFPDLWRARDVQHIALAPLPRRAAERLVRAVVGGADASTVARLVDLSGGNAFFLEELIRFQMEGRIGEDRVLPGTVVAMVQTRLETLDPATRRLLRAASIFGEVFWEDGVLELLGETRDAAAARQGLDDLVRRELLSRRTESRLAGQAELVFRHAFVREAAYAMLTLADRALGHRLAARWLEASGEHDASVLAGHYETAGDSVEAVDCYARAMAQALAGDDLARVLSLGERARLCGPGGAALRDILHCEAEAHLWRGSLEAAKASAEQAALDLAAGDPLWAELSVVRASACQKLGREADLVTLGEELARALEAGRATPATARAAGHVAMIVLQQGLRSLSARLLAAARGVAPEALDALSRSRELQARATLANYQGDPAEELRLRLLTVAELELAGYARGLCVTQMNIGFSYVELGDSAEGERWLRRAVVIAERLQLPAEIARIRQNLGWTLVRQGKLEQARRILTEVLDTLRGVGDRRFEGSTRVYLATLYLKAGELGAAEREARCVAEMQDTAPTSRIHGLALLTTCLLARDAPADALTAIRQAMAMFTSAGGIEEGEASIYLAYVDALAANGDEDGARRELRAARDRLLERAARISDSALRASFLERVPEHVETLALARDKLGPL